MSNHLEGTSCRTCTRQPRSAKACRGRRGARWILTDLLGRPAGEGCRLYMCGVIKKKLWKSHPQKWTQFLVAICFCPPENIYFKQSVLIERIVDFDLFKSGFFISEFDFLVIPGGQVGCLELPSLDRRGGGQPSTRAAYGKKMS